MVLIQVKHPRERATVEETELPAKQIVRFIRIGVGTQPLRK
jgi:hypothetical protein